MLRGSDVTGYSYPIGSVYLLDGPFNASAGVLGREAAHRRSMHAATAAVG